MSRLMNDNEPTMPVKFAGHVTGSTEETASMICTSEMMIFPFFVLGGLSCAPASGSSASAFVPASAAWRLRSAAYAREWRGDCDRQHNAIVMRFGRGFGANTSEVVWEKMGIVRSHPAPHRAVWVGPSARASFFFCFLSSALKA